MVGGASQCEPVSIENLTMTLDSRPPRWVVSLHRYCAAPGGDGSLVPGVDAATVASGVCGDDDPLGGLDTNGDPAGSGLSADAPRRRLPVGSRWLLPASAKALPPLLRAQYDCVSKLGRDEWNGREAVCEQLSKLMLSPRGLRRVPVDGAPGGDGSLCGQAGADGMVAPNATPSRIVVDVCRPCKLALMRDKLPIHAIANHNWIGYLPEQFRDTTPGEFALLKFAYRVGGRFMTLDGGRGHASFTGHMHHLVRDAGLVTRVLPLSPGEVDFRVAFLGAHSSSYSHVPLRWVRIRRERVADVLTFYRENNAVLQYGMEQAQAATGNVSRAALGGVYLSAARLAELPLDGIPAAWMDQPATAAARAKVGPLAARACALPAERDVAAAGTAAVDSASLLDAGCSAEACDMDWEPCETECAGTDPIEFDADAYMQSLGAQDAHGELLGDESDVQGGGGARCEASGFKGAGGPPGGTGTGSSTYVSMFARWCESAVVVPCAPLATRRDDESASCAPLARRGEDDSLSDASCWSHVPEFDLDLCEFNADRSNGVLEADLLRSGNAEVLRQLLGGAFELLGSGTTDSSAPPGGETDVVELTMTCSSDDPRMSDPDSWVSQHLRGGRPHVGSRDHGSLPEPALSQVRDADIEARRMCGQIAQPPLPGAPASGGREGASTPHAREFEVRASTEFCNQQDGDFLLKAYPEKFPFGFGGYISPDRLRPFRGQAAYFEHLCRLSIGSFQDAEMQLFMHDRTAQHSIAKAAYVSAVMPAANHAAGPSAPLFARLSADDVRLAASYMESCGKARKAGRKLPPPPASQTLASGFFKSLDRCVSAASSYAEASRRARADVTAIHQELGTATFFITVAPNDRFAPSLVCLCLDDLRSHRSEVSDPCLLPMPPRSFMMELPGSSPGACALNFERFFDTFVRHGLGWDVRSGVAVPGGGLFGTLKAWFGCVEEQKRKHLHFHFVAWTAKCSAPLSRVANAIGGLQAGLNEMAVYLDSVVRAVSLLPPGCPVQVPCREPGCNNPASFLVPVHADKVAAMRRKGCTELHLVHCGACGQTYDTLPILREALLRAWRDAGLSGEPPQARVDQPACDRLLWDLWRPGGLHAPDGALGNCDPSPAVLVWRARVLWLQLHWLEHGHYDACFAKGESCKSRFPFDPVERAFVSASLASGIKVFSEGAPSRPALNTAPSLPAPAGATPVSRFAHRIGTPAASDIEANCSAAAADFSVPRSSSGGGLCRKRRVTEVCALAGAGRCVKTRYVVDEAEHSGSADSSEDSDDGADPVLESDGDVDGFAADPVHDAASNRALDAQRDAEYDKLAQSVAAAYEARGCDGLGYNDDDGASGDDDAMAAAEVASVISSGLPVDFPAGVSDVATKVLILKFDEQRGVFDGWRVSTNCALLALCKSNCNVQAVTSQAITYYVCKYTSKPNKENAQSLRAAVDGAEKVLRTPYAPVAPTAAARGAGFPGPGGDQPDSNAEFRRGLRVLTSAAREHTKAESCGAPRAAFVNLRGRVFFSSHSFVNVLLVQALAVIDNLPVSGQVRHGVFCSSIEDYVNRPEAHEGLSFFAWMTQYEVLGSPATGADRLPGSRERLALMPSHPGAASSSVAQRTKRVFGKIIGPRLPDADLLTDDGACRAALGASELQVARDLYARCALALHVPWRRPSDLIPVCQSAWAAYNHAMSDHKFSPEAHTHLANLQSSYEPCADLFKDPGASGPDDAAGAAAVDDAAPWLQPGDPSREALGTAPSVVRVVPPARRTPAADMLAEHACFGPSCLDLLPCGLPVSRDAALAADTVLRAAAKNGLVEPPPLPAPLAACPTMPAAGTSVVEREVAAAGDSAAHCAHWADGPASAARVAADPPQFDGVRDFPTMTEHSRNWGLDADQHVVFVAWAAAVLDKKLRAVDDGGPSSAWHSSYQGAHEAVKSLLAGQDQIVGYCAGEGGCGKTHVLRCVLDFAKRHGGDALVRVLAHTGSAASNVGCLCHTIHSGTSMNGLKPGRDSLKIVTREDRDNWAEVGVLFLEECSLCSSADLGRLDMRLRALKQCDSLPFGGLHVFFLGDLYQLTMGQVPYAKPAPVHDHAAAGDVTQPAAAGTKQAKQKSRDLETLRLSEIGREAWARIAWYAELTTNFRFRDAKFAAVLKRLRLGLEEPGDIDYLNQRLVLAGTELPPGLVYATPHNDVRRNVNHLAFCASLAAANTGLHCGSSVGDVAAAWCTGGHLRVLMTVGASGGRVIDGELADAVRLIGDDKFHGKTGVLEVRLGGPAICVAENIAPHLGICNGADVFFDQLVLEHDARLFLSQTDDGQFVPTCYASSVAALIVCHRSTSPHAEIDRYGLGPGRFPLFRKQGTHKVVLNEQEVQVTALQLPVVPAVCKTGHKLQGHTLVALGILGFVGVVLPAAWLYTVLSRVRRWADLYLFEPLVPGRDGRAFRPRPQIDAEMDRLRTVGRTCAVNVAIAARLGYSVAGRAVFGFAADVLAAGPRVLARGRRGRATRAPIGGPPPHEFTADWIARADHVRKFIKNALSKKRMPGPCAQQPSSKRLAVSAALKSPCARDRVCVLPPAAAVTPVASAASDAPPALVGASAVPVSSAASLHARVLADGAASVPARVLADAVAVPVLVTEHSDQSPGFPPGYLVDALVTRSLPAPDPRIAWAALCRLLVCPDPRNPNNRLEPLLAPFRDREMICRDYALADAFMDSELRRPRSELRVVLENVLAHLSALGEDAGLGLCGHGGWAQRIRAGGVFGAGLFARRVVRASARGVAYQLGPVVGASVFGLADDAIELLWDFVARYQVDALRHQVRSCATVPAVVGATLRGMPWFLSNCCSGAGFVVIAVLLASPSGADLLVLARASAAARDRQFCSLFDCYNTLLNTPFGATWAQWVQWCRGLYTYLEAGTPAEHIVLGAGEKFRLGHNTVFSAFWDYVFDGTVFARDAMRLSVPTVCGACGALGRSTPRGGVLSSPLGRHAVEIGRRSSSLVHEQQYIDQAVGVSGAVLRLAGGVSSNVGWACGACRAEAVTGVGVMTDAPLWLTMRFLTPGNGGLNAAGDFMQPSSRSVRVWLEGHGLVFYIARAYVYWPHQGHFSCDVYSAGTWRHYDPFKHHLCPLGGGPSCFQHDHDAQDGPSRKLWWHHFRPTDLDTHQRRVPRCRSRERERPQGGRDGERDGWGAGRDRGIAGK